MNTMQIYKIQNPVISRPVAAGKFVSIPTIARTVSAKYHPPTLPRPSCSQQAPVYSQQSVRKWQCRLCKKLLSSKRSYEEHYNIHKAARPFRCKFCDYAAASQMTLRRHNLRNHTDKGTWGYRCPYCTQSFMEPASYQMHVSSHHPGMSCTYGCPQPNCHFSCKSETFFRNHLSKHTPEGLSSTGHYDDAHPSSWTSQRLKTFLVDDSLDIIDDLTFTGRGYDLPTMMGQMQVMERPRQVRFVLEQVDNSRRLPNPGVRYVEEEVYTEVDGDLAYLPDDPSPPVLVKYGNGEDYLEEEEPLTSSHSPAYEDEIAIGDDWIADCVDVTSASETTHPDGQMDIPLD